MLAAVWRTVAIVTLLAIVSTACRVDTAEVGLRDLAAAPAASISTPSELAGLPVLGPIPSSSHWHAAYVVRVCDDVLAPFDTDNDPLGIHSHNDGIMHVHPFFEEAGYESATLGLFADAMGLGLADGELTLPGGGTWRDGDLCNGVPGRVFVDRWQDPDPESEVERIFENLSDIRYLADGELYQIAFAPADSFPVVPPTTARLGEYSSLAPAGQPWVDVDPTATIADVSFWGARAVSESPCTGDAVPERVLFGEVRCFTPSVTKLSGAEAVTAARAVILNRQPAVELRITPTLGQVMFQHFAQTEDPFALAIEADGFVLTAALVQRAPVSDRLVVSGGLSAESATALANLLNG